MSHIDAFTLMGVRSRAGPTKQASFCSSHSSQLAHSPRGCPFSRSVLAHAFSSPKMHMSGLRQSTLPEM